MTTTRTARAVLPALGLALLLTTGGCGRDAAPAAPPAAPDPTTSPGTGDGAPAARPPAPSEAPVLRVEDVGGFTAASASLARVPAVSVYADGRVVTLAPDPAGGPPPALPPLVQHDVGEAGVARLVALATDAGIGTDADVGRPNLADATSTRFSVVVDGKARSTEVYALREAAPTSDPAWSGGLGGGNGFDDGLTDDQRSERERLLELRAALTGVEATLPEAAGPASPYRPSALAVLAEPLGTTREGDDGNPLPWPGPALPGATVGTTQATCVLADGAALGPALDAAAEADARRPWSWQGERWALAFRPLLPDETGCADGAGPGPA